MVSKGLAGAAALAMAFASAGAFAPGKAFIRAPLSPSTYGIEKAVNVDGAKSTSTKVSKVRRATFVIPSMFDWMFFLNDNRSVLRENEGEWCVILLYRLFTNASLIYR